MNSVLIDKIFTINNIMNTHQQFLFLNILNKYFRIGKRQIIKLLVKKTIVLIVIFILGYSCSPKDDTSPTFYFFEFEKDIIVPSLLEREFVIFGTDFDKNESIWELELVDEDDNNLSVTINRIEDTGGSFSEGVPIQKMVLNIPPMNNGVYSLSIRNIITAQIHTSYFLVRNETFNNIYFHYATSYNLIFSYTPGEEEPPTRDWFYFHNNDNAILSDIDVDNVLDISLEDKISFKEYNIDYSIDNFTNSGKVVFNIPENVPTGTYYLSVRYQDLTRTYFEKDIVLIPTKIPEVTSINKNNFTKGENILISGNNFYYEVDHSLYPAGNFHKVKIQYFMRFTDTAASDHGINAFSDVSLIEDNTKMKYPIPVSEPYSPSNNNTGNSFDGFVNVRLGPFISSNSFPITIDY